MQTLEVSLIKKKIPLLTLELIHLMQENWIKLIYTFKKKDTVSLKVMLWNLLEEILFSRMHKTLDYDFKVYQYLLLQ